MRRRSVAIASAAAALAIGGGLLVAPQAQAEEDGPSLCIHLDVTIQDQNQIQDLCLPPEGGEAPGLPELPGGELPSLPGLPTP